MWIQPKKAQFYAKLISIFELERLNERIASPIYTFISYNSNTMLQSCAVQLILTLISCHY